MSDINNDLYNRGLECEYLGKSVKDMSDAELIEFIGQLDYMVTTLIVKIDEIKP